MISRATVAALFGAASIVVTPASAQQVPDRAAPSRDQRDEHCAESLRAASHSDPKSRRRAEARPATDP